MTKKREILAGLNLAIICLSKMSADAAKLEIMDNDQASRRLKKSIVDFKHNELDNFTKTVFAVRADINNKPKKNKKENTDNININQ